MAADVLCAFSIKISACAKVNLPAALFMHYSSARNENDPKKTNRENNRYESQGFL